MLDAGLKALSHARSRLSEGQEKVVQSLIDPFGIRKLEEVFDQRVAAALERLGWPAPDDYAQLKARMDDFDARLRRLEAALRRKS